MSIEAILQSARGLVIAPAGCGKTHLITEALNVAAEKPYLVLTHTTAGVAALKHRLKCLNVNKSNFIVSTIDGWALHIVKSFPASCVINATPDNSKFFYPELRRKVNLYVKAGNLSKALLATYARVFVDEYQDCDFDQHAMICSLSEILPTVVFGDPMQCIFDFGGKMPSWSQDVETWFPKIVELDTPWRWKNAGADELGQWLLDIRQKLLNGQKINLLGCPKYVNWHKLSGNYQEDARNQCNSQYKIMNIKGVGSLLVIGDSINVKSRHQHACKSNGIDVVEPVDMKDVIFKAGEFDQKRGVDLLDSFLVFLSEVMTGVRKTEIRDRVEKIMSGRSKKAATSVELAARDIVELGTRMSLLNGLKVFMEESGAKIFRKDALHVLKEGLSHSTIDNSKTIRQAVEVVREQRRHQGGRRISLRTIGSTLLLKGLESEHSLILNAGQMNASNIYVALTRAAKSVTVFSANNICG